MQRRLIDLLTKSAALLLSPRLILILFAACFCCSSARAQQFSFSLDDLPEYTVETAWDTLRPGDIKNLSLGEWHRIPNFLEHDFSRKRLIEEYYRDGAVRFIFEVPRIYPFEFTEEKQGVFYILHPRNLSVPGLKISIDFIDDISERIRKSTLENEWREGSRNILASQKKEAQERTGLIHVTIPIPLPKTVERIIGSGENTNIDISGRESITFAGESRRVSPFIGVEGQQKQPLFPSLDMKQELDVRLQGTIGEKINVQVDHTSNAFSAKQNRIRLNYKGFDDDVIKLIEMGNTTLSLPGSQLVSFSAASQGLFGIKALAQVGSMDLTMIASKQEGETSQASFTPRGAAFGQTETKTIRDIDYVKDRYFFLDLPMGNVFFSPQEGSVEIFESVYPYEKTINPDLQAFPGKSWVDRFGDGSDIRSAVSLLNQGQAPPPFQEADFRLMTLGQDYRFVLNADDESVLGIELVQSINTDRVLAVRYINENGDTTGNYNDFSDTLALEIIKPRNPLPTDDFGYTWHYMMRNIYNLGLSNIDAASLELEIEDVTNRLDRSAPENSEIPYLRIFGLDRTDESGTGPPDNRIDLTTGLIDLQNGILTFPSLRPFDPPPEFVAEWTDSLFSFTGEYADFPVPEIYDEFLTIPEEYHTFNIVIKASSMAKTFFIDAFNIIEGSEIVTLDGKKLARNRDYTIDYDIGEVELKGAVLDEITPASRININYEFKPFAGGASSSLIGISSLLHLSQNSRIGSTWLYESKSSGAGRPRLGEESSRSIIGDVDGYLQFNSQLLTDIANKLPLVDTEAKSTVTLSGEVAMSFPDPNTEGEASIDDMEGIEDSDIFPMTRNSWFMASPPLDPEDAIGNSKLSSQDRESFFWYNIEPQLGVHRLDWNPQLDERENTLIQSLDIEVDSVSADTTRWVGVMTGFSSGGLDMSRGQFLELWINDFKPDFAARGGQIHVELGNIDEDFFEPDKDEYNTEDKNRDGFNALNEDTGLDGEYENQGGVDIAGDDYDPNRINGRFKKINGTERNGILDDEDLDNSGQMEKDNTYFRFTVDLTDSAIVDVQRDFPGQVRDPNDSWRMYRLNLSDAEIVSPTGSVPRWERIRHLRIWFDHPQSLMNSSERRFQIAGFKVVGNRWEEDGIRDLADQLLTAPGGDFKLGVISTKTDPIAYIPPFNPEERDQIAAKEQSLFVKFNNIGPESAFRIRKRFPGTGMDFTAYKEMHTWVHANIRSDSLEYYFRVAFDSLNYYEISFPLTDQYLKASGWILSSIKLTDLSDLKFLDPDSVVTGNIRDVGDPSKTYRTSMVGRPNLFNVRFLYAGVRNTSSQDLQSGEIWMDDIYLGGVKRDIDFANRFTTSLSFANVLNLNFGWRRTGPDYHGLRQKRGSGTESSSINFNGKTRLEYFIPLFGFTIPVSGNYTRSTSLPKFRPNSDTEISDKAIQDSLKTQNITRGFSTTVSKSGSKNPLFKYTFDKVKANFSMSQTRRVSPSSTDTTTTMTGTFDYQMFWSRKKRVRIFKDYRLRYWLNSITFRVQASRKTGRRYRLTNLGKIPDPPFYFAALQSSGSASYVPFPSLTTSFKMSMKRDAKLRHKWLGVDIGRETNRSQTVQANYKPPPVWLVGAFSPDMHYSGTYTEDSSPNIRKAGDPRGVRNVSNGRTLGFKTRFDMGGVFKKIFKRLHLLERKKKFGKPLPPKGLRTGKNLKSVQGKDDESASSTSPAKADSTKKETKRDPAIALRRLGGILSRIRKINASVQQRTSSSYSRIPERPSLSYQIGLSKKSGLGRDAGEAIRPERDTKNLNITFDSGTEISKNIDIAARYTTNFTNSNFRTSKTNSRRTTWPDLNLSWSGLAKYGALPNLVTSTSLAVNYKKSSQESGRGDNVESGGSTVQLSPSLIAKWKNGMNTTLSFSRSKKENVSHGSKTEIVNYQVSLNLKYSFSGGSGLRIPLPFLSKRIKFKSRLDTTLDMSYNRTGGKRSSEMLVIPQPIPGTNTLKISPRLTYNFSRSLNGSFFTDFTRSYSEASNQTTTLVRVGINAIFTF